MAVPVVVPSVARRNPSSDFQLRAVKLPTPGRLWWLLRRDLERGWRASYHAHITLPKIERWHFPNWAEEPSGVSLHVLTGEKDWRLAAWMLASWMHWTRATWKIVVHDDGTLPNEGRHLLEHLFPSLEVIGRAEADAAMDKTLATFPHCRAYRERHPLSLKVFDVLHFSPGERYMIFDSDVIFFRRPEAILAWCRNGTDECWFNEDVAEGTLVPASEAMEKLGVELWPRVNNGLALIAKKAVELEFCERCLAETSINDGHIWRIEQTLYALCASRHGRGGLLPRQYEISLGRDAAPDAVTRHYVGAVRDRLYAEALPRLQGALFGNNGK
jgi:hypothetical protein